MTALWLYLDTHEAVVLWAAVVLGITIGTWAVSRRNKRIRRDDRRTLIARREELFSDDTEAAIGEALEVAEPIDWDSELAEYMRAHKRDQSGATSLLAVVVPAGLFVAGLLVVAVEALVRR